MRYITIILLIFLSQAVFGQQLKIKYFTEDSLMRHEYFVKPNTDSLHGESKFFNSNGVLVEHREYKNDGLWNVIAVYDHQGQQIMNHGTLKDGTGTVFIYEEGIRRNICTYENGIKHGQYISFYDNEVVKETGNYYHGSKCGFTYHYLQNGQLMHHQLTIQQIDCRGNDINH